MSWFSNQLFRVVLSRRMVVEAGPLGLTRAQINEWITMRNRARFGRSQRLRYRGSDGNEGRDQGVGVRCRCRPRERAAVGCLSAADTAYIRRETRYAKRDPGSVSHAQTVFMLCPTARAASISGHSARIWPALVEGFSARRRARRDRACMIQSVELFTSFPPGTNPPKY